MEFEPGLGILFAFWLLVGNVSEKSDVKTVL